MARHHVICHTCTFEALAPSGTAAEKAVDAHERKEPDHSVESARV